MTDPKPLESHYQTQLEALEKRLEGQTGNFSRINDVGSSTSKEYWRRYAWLTIFLIVIALAWIGGVSYYGHRDWWAVLPIIVLVYLSMTYGRLQSKIEAEFMRQFAASVGLTYTDKGDPGQEAGTLFHLGHSTRMRHVVSGKIRGLDYMLCHLSFTVGYGKHSKTFERNALEITFPVTLPRISLDYDGLYVGHVDSLSTSFTRALNADILGGKKVAAMSRLQKISLEPGLERTFDLYCEPKMEIEALQIFTPTVLAELSTNWPKVGFEFIGQSMYLYYPQHITHLLDLRKLWDMGQWLALHLSPKVAGMAGSVKAMQEAFTKK